MKYAILNTVAILFFIVSTAFSQDVPATMSEPEPPAPVPEPAPAPSAPEPIRFQIPLDSNGMPLPIVIPSKPDTVQKLGLASNLPLNLSILTARDTAGFETYSKRYALIQDSISAINKQIEAVKKNTESFMPILEPKNEFEKQMEYDARKQKWDKELKQREEKDTKSLAHRLAELEKAKSKILEIQASFYASLEIKSEPFAVPIWINKEEIGITPFNYEMLIPGETKIRLQKEGYNTWDTILQIEPWAKYRLNVILEEKSIFSQKNEINFAKFLSKDTTVQGYKSRIKAIHARKAEINEEIVKILENFSKTYPPLEPQKEYENFEVFENRRNEWNKKGVRQYSELQKKHKTYINKLARSVETLNDYIIASQSSIVIEDVLTPYIELGSYDAEREEFSLVAQDTASLKSPFIFSGKVEIPPEDAKTMNRAKPGLDATLYYINYPFETDSVKVNLAMTELNLSMNGHYLRMEGSFGEIARYKQMEGYAAWKLRADSLMNGKLDAQGLDYAYAITDLEEAAAAAAAAASNSSGSFWKSRSFRVTMFGISAASLGFGLWQNNEISSKNKKAKVLKDFAKSRIDDPNPDRYRDAYNEFGRELKSMNSNKNLRAGFYAGAGVFGAVWATSFFF